MIRRQRVAATEQARADGLARQIDQIRQQPGHPMRESLPLFQDAYRDASGNAARNTRQPR